MEDRVRVLFVDDDELVLSALRRLFSKEPYELFFANNAKLGLQIVPYKGTAPALTDVVANQVQLMISALPGTMPFINSKRVVPLATTGAISASAPRCGEPKPRPAISISTPKMSRRYSARLEISSGSTTVIAAPTSGPSVQPAPPTTTASRTSSTRSVSRDPSTSSSSSSSIFHGFDPHFLTKLLFRH